jgi:hypothetical protein
MVAREPASHRVHRDPRPLRWRSRAGGPESVPVWTLDPDATSALHAGSRFRTEWRRHDRHHLDLDLERHGLRRRHCACCRRFGWLGDTGDLSQWPVRDSGLLAARHRRARAGLAAHHLRRASPGSHLRTFGGLFVRGCRPRCRCRARRAGCPPNPGGRLVVRRLRRRTLGEPQPGPDDRRGAGRRGAAARLAHRRDGAGDPSGLPSPAVADGAAARDRSDAADVRAGDGGLQHRGRRTCA